MSRKNKIPAKPKTLNLRAPTITTYISSKVDIDYLHSFPIYLCKEKLYINLLILTIKTTWEKIQYPKNTKYYKNNFQKGKWFYNAFTVGLAASIPRNVLTISNSSARQHWHSFRFSSDVKQKVSGRFWKSFWKELLHSVPNPHSGWLFAFTL